MGSLRTCGLSALAALVLTASAYANAMFIPGNVPQPNEEEVHLHPSAVCTTPGTDANPCTVSGTTNHSRSVVDFVSTENQLTASGGQSDLDTVSGTGDIKQVTISLQNGLGFKDLIIDPQKINADDGITATVQLSDGLTDSRDFGRQHGMPGQNFLTIVATGDELIQSVNLTSDFGFNDLKQTRISGIVGVVIPEPSSMLLLGTGLLVFTHVLRRKLKLSKGTQEGLGISKRRVCSRGGPPMKKRFIEIALTTVMLITSAYANIIFNQGNVSFSLTTIDVTTGPTGGAPPGTPIDGTIASAGRRVAVELTSDSDRLIGSSGGGNICAVSCTGSGTDDLHNVTLQLPGFAFTNIQLNPAKPAGDLTYTVFTCTLISSDICVPEPQPFTRTFAPQSGENRMNITANAFSSCGQVPGCVPGNEVITRVTLDVPAGFDNLNQIRLSSGISDIEDVEILDVIPEPSSMVLLGTGVLVCTQVLRRKLKLGFGTRSA